MYNEEENENHEKTSYFVPNLNMNKKPKAKQLKCIQYEQQEQQQLIILKYLLIATN